MTKRSPLLLTVCLALTLVGCNADTTPPTQVTTTATTTDTTPPTQVTTAAQTTTDTTLVESSTTTTRRSPEGSRLFDTEGITAVTVFARYSVSPREWTVLPEQMADMLLWLDACTVGQEMTEPIPPGANAYSIRVVYADGHTVESVIDYVTIDGVLYRVERPAIPEVWYAAPVDSSC